MDAIGETGAADTTTSDEAAEVEGPADRIAANRNGRETTVGGSARARRARADRARRDRDARSDGRKEFPTTEKTIISIGEGCYKNLHRRNGCSVSL